MILNQKNLQNSGQFWSEITQKLLVSKEFFVDNLPWWLDIDYSNCVSQVKQIYSKCSKYEKLLVLGIWGSALWTSSVLTALSKSDNILVLDSIDPEYCERVFSRIDWENTLINVISKSWSTLETLAQISVVKSILESKNLNLKDKIVVTTWSNGVLRDFADEYDLLSLDVPEGAGWRFSVFTQVWLFPLLFAWVDIDEFIRATALEFESFKNNEFENNIPLLLAASQIEACESQKKNISVLMTYNKKLYWLLDWYRQLLAESIWKRRSIWITPVLAIWSTDQHSQLQLYLEGPSDKHFTFVNTKNIKWPITWDDFQYLISKSFWEIQDAFFEWTKKAFCHYGVNYQEIEIETSELSVAKFITNLMIAIWLMGEYFWINAYDQPAVEFGKGESRRILIESEVWRSEF